MLELLQYREASYFNNKDYFLVFTSLDRFYVTQLYQYNGIWYTVEGCAYKATSIKSINCNELYHKEVTFFGSALEGMVTKFISPDGIGVLWKQGQGKIIKITGLPNYWNRAENLKIK